MGKRRKCSDNEEPLLLAKGGDLIQKILVWLPVVSLGRFKSVCKSWCALIESSLFVDLHTATTFNSSSSSSEFGSFILLASHNEYSHETFKTSKQLRLMTLSSSVSGSNPDDQVINNNLGGGSSSNDDQLVLKLDCLGAPSCYEGCQFYKEIVGSCNGLVCFYDRMPNKICLWNPVTKQKKILPKPMNIGEEWPNHLVAFGFDVETKDYKVLQLTGYTSSFFSPEAEAPMDCICRAQLYCLSTDSWRFLEGITCLPGDPFRYPGDVLCLNGSCFFTAGFFHTKQQPCIPENDRFIISFDFTKEIITPMQLPDHHRDQELYLSYLGDKIALFTATCPNGLGLYGYVDYSIWVLNEHGSSSENKESWTKLHSFQMEVGPGDHNEPRGISNDGVFALIETSSPGLGMQMSLYHLEYKQVLWNFLDSLVLSKANAYKPSLVSIIGANGCSSRNSRSSRSRSRNSRSSRSRSRSRNSRSSRSRSRRSNPSSRR